MRKLFAVCTAALMTGGLALAGATAPASAAGLQAILCHATPPDTAAQGWLTMPPLDDDAIVKQGHDGHTADIIPAIGTYPGKNLTALFGWGATGAQVLANGCSLPAKPTPAIPPAEPTPAVPPVVPPVTDPPVTEPPVTEPPVTGPPVTEPPATEPPVTEPPANDPPMTEPPVTEPPAHEPPVTEPPAHEPPLTAPPVTEPPVTEPPVTAPPAAEPPATEPPVAEPPLTEPPVIEPPVTQTPDTDPPALTPEAIPPATDPPASGPPVTEHPATDPPVTGPPALVTPSLLSAVRPLMLASTGVEAENTGLLALLLFLAGAAVLVAVRRRGLKSAPLTTARPAHHRHAANRTPGGRRVWAHRTHVVARTGIRQRH